MSDPMTAADDTRTEIAGLLAGHHCRMPKKGPIECWSTLDDQECGLRFTTGGQYRAHIAGIIAEYVATKQASAWTKGYLSGWDDRHKDQHDPLPAGEQHDTENLYWIAP